MVFSSLEFIFIFMPIFFIVYYAVPNKCKNFILLLGSLAFYAVGTAEAPVHFLIFILSMITDYVVARLIEKYRTRKKVFLIIGVVVHLVFLGFFKYFGFIGGEISKFIPSFELSLNILLPIGISFYTFQGISYIADVYKGKVKAETNAIDFFVYISMFPQLIAGPIVTYPCIEERLHGRVIKKHEAFEGFGVFVFGMGLKVLLANPIGKLWKDITAIGFESVSTPLAWMGIFAVTFQLYFDFFGYSLMAIGLGKMLGFNFPKNFDFPYLAKSMTEFWRRWHITLGSWFREYVYIPLGGNRKGNFKTVCNLLIVWLLTGVWHGAGYNFLLWGLVLFILIVTEKYFTGRFLQKSKVISRIYMLLLIPLSWAIFSIDDIGQLGVFFTRLFPFFGQGVWSEFRYDYVKYFNMYWIFFVVGILFSSKLPFNLLEKLKSVKVKNKPIFIYIILLAIFMGSVYCLYRGFNDPFLYFRF